MSRWKDKSNPQVVLDELNRRFSLDEKGNVTSESIISGNLFGVVADMFKFNEQIPEDLNKSILRNSFYKIIKEKKVTLQNLQKNICIEENKYLGMPMERYHLVTSISIHQNVKMPTINIDGARISITPSLPKKYVVARKKILRMIDGREYDVGGLANQFVVVTVAGKTTDEAADLAIDKLSFVRAIWNFYFNYDQTWRISMDRPKCVNKFKTGQYHSVHNLNGSLATDTWWYEPSFSSVNVGHILKGRYEAALNCFQLNLKRIKKLPYRKELEKYLINYVNALDSDDLHSSFLKLWVVLEQITGTTFKDKKIDRAARIYSEYSLNIEIVHYLRNFRDKAIHHNSSSQDIETMLFHLKYVVEDHLLSLIHNKYRFKSVNDFREFWDLPMSLKDIEKNQKEYKTKIKRLEQIKRHRQLI